jgi:two-component system sensor histidine kinase BaeS
MMSRVGVGVRVTIAMTLIAVAAVLLTVALASRSVDTSLDDYSAALRQQPVQVAGPPQQPPEAVTPQLVAAEDRFIDHRLMAVRTWGVGLALIAALLSAGLISVTLVRPLRRLTLAADRMGEGDLAARADVGGGAELAQLGSSFNRMAASLAREDELRRAAAADIAHELRTPVTGIVARIEAAQDGVMADPEANLVAMHEEALRLARLIEDVSQLAEAEKPELLVEKSRVDVGAVVRQRATAQADFFRAKGIAFERDVRPVAVHADASRVEQIVDNLLSNALRYTDAGGVVRLRAGRRGPNAVLEVSDTGIGIAPDELPRIFDRFWRSDRSRSRATGGSGIGLAVVRELVDAHGGEVEVESAPGRGTLFRVTLPALRAERVHVPTMGRPLVSAAG